MSRDCKKCIHHISGSCDAWECNMKTLEDYRNKVIDEFLHNAETKITDMILQHQGQLDFASGLAVANRMLDEIAEQLKGGAE